jgi:DNA-directed RNA polymerase specialized sigma24 family protein
LEAARDASGSATAFQVGANGPYVDEGGHGRTWAALQGLPASLRKILLLREVEQLPMEEVAARLRLSRVAAERRWIRAIVHMTERLAEAELGHNSR